MFAKPRELDCDDAGPGKKSSLKSWVEPLRLLSNGRRTRIIAKQGRSFIYSSIHFGVRMLKLRLLHLEFYGPDYSGALEYLKARGFYLDSDLQWRVRHGFRFTRKDYRAVEFLALEWGYSVDVVQDEELIPPRHRQH